MLDIRTILGSKVLAGCFAGNSPISKAYLADLGSGERDLKNIWHGRMLPRLLYLLLDQLLGG